MTNGSNTWNVSYSHIAWLDRFLRVHANVSAVERNQDIRFVVDRKSPNDQLRILCCNEYTFGLTLVQRALHEFGSTNIIYVGGGWCGYTEEAKAFCLDQRIGLFVTDEMSGAIWRNDYWTYHKRDKEGNPVYYYRVA